jgi:hypothetical protein
MMGHDRDCEAWIRGYRAPRLDPGSATRDGAARRRGGREARRGAESSGGE